MRVPATTSLTHDPRVLYPAALERIEEAQLLYEQECWVLSMYVSGLAVETLLQAFALRSDRVRDAKHDLRAWLRKCPAQLIDVINRSAGAEWSHLSTVWSNSLRYQSKSGMLGYLRGLDLQRTVKAGKSGPDAVVRENARRLLSSARIVHDKGISLWHAHQ